LDDSLGNIGWIKIYATLHENGTLEGCYQGGHGSQRAVAQDKKKKKIMYGKVMPVLIKALPHEERCYSSAPLK
jgi:hypothetical protein